MAKLGHIKQLQNHLQLTEVCNFGHFWLSYGRSAMSGSPMGQSKVAPKQ